MARHINTMSGTGKRKKMTPHEYKMAVMAKHAKKVSAIASAELRKKIANRYKIVVGYMCFVSKQ